MEVHHHPHVEKKKFKEYFLEFLMIFLAVTLGFIAENIREGNVDKEREKVYIRNLYEDLKSDTAIYSQYIRSGNGFADDIDSLMKMMKSPNRNAYLSKVYFYTRSITINSNIVIPDERTFSQLKNSGLLRLITNQQVAADISSYYLLTDEVLSQNSFILGQIAEYWKEVGNLFDAETLYGIRKERKPPVDKNLALITNDVTVINRFLASAQYLYGSRVKQNESAIERLRDAKALLALIYKKYHLKNE